jgi:predicted Zn-dependent protease
MKNAALRLAVALLLVVCLAPSVVPGAPESTAETRPDILLATLQQELHRAATQLSKSDPAPYFLSYSATDEDLVAIVASYGSVLTSVGGHSRSADVTMRVGAPALDNTHGQSRPSGIISGLLPLEDDPDAIARVLWELTAREYRHAAPAYLQVKTQAAVRTEEEDKSSDFSQEPPQNHVKSARLPFSVDRRAWEEKLSRYSSYFRKHPDVYVSGVVFLAKRTRSYLVSTEGSSVVASSTFTRLFIQAETRAEDGMELLRVESFQASLPDQLPSETEIAARIERMADDLRALRAAPVAEPFAGPALLSGKAAAVFFHEVLGHRLEGHRQRGEEEGQTFTRKVNQQVLPEFLSVVDNPTQRELHGLLLSGWYEYDDEGVPAARVEVIKDGVLKNFLMSRMPIKNFSKSNGHGRAQPGRMPTGRQGNLMVTSSKTVKDSELRQKLIEEVKQQGKPYGLYFEDIQGGFTLTGRALPQVFQVLPVMVWRVYADGHPDELVRGVDIVGTPLAALNLIVLAGDTLQVFNCMCGAESGNVPVAAVAPPMLFSEIEVQKRAHSHDRPPILPPPGFESAAPKPAPSGKQL